MKIALIFALAAALQPANLVTPGVTRPLALPAAADHADVISLGQSIDPQTGVIVDGYALIQRQAPAKPAHVGGGNGNSTTNSCYAFMARGAKWKTVEPWIFNPHNTAGLDTAWVMDNFSQSVAKWESAAEVDVLGNGSLTVDALEADTTTPDGLNEVLFGAIDEPGVIGVTIVWGVFGGPTQNRQLTEWDQVYDQVDFSWSASGEAGKMDFENISTHELGHTIGLTHPADTCAQETMYRYADYGETIRRDLNAGDIAGAAALY
jgi:hypothetical protein